MKTLRAIREEKGVTKKAVSNHLGVTDKTYSKYENHPETMKVETAKRIADFLNVEVSDIFFASNSN